MRKNLLKKVLASTFVLALTMGAVPVNATTARIDLASDVEKPAVIKAMWDGTLQANEENGRDEIVAKYKELTGIDLVINQPAHNEYVEKVNLAFATGDVPDALILNTNLYSKFATYGALADITELYENSETKDHYIDQGYVDSIRLSGKLYGLPQVAGNGTITYVRQDWLEALDMDMPTTFDEFIDMLRAFRDNDLNGSGKNDAIPLTGPGLVNTEYPLDIYLREFFQDATPDFVLKDGEYVDGMLEPNTAEALIRMADAFAEGLIDKEIVTNNTSTAREKYYLGNVGVFNYWAGNWNNTIQTNTEKNVPDAKVVAMPALEGIKYIERPPVPFSITSSCKNVEGVFKYLLEFMVDEGEGQHLFTYGVEGVTYDMVDGKVVFRPLIAGTGNFSKAYMDGALTITHFEDIVDRPELLHESTATYRENCQYYGIYPSSEAYSSYISDLNKMRATTVSKIVYGESELDAELAKYASDSKAYVEAILAEFNE